MSKQHSIIPSYFCGILHAVYLVMLRSGLSKQGVAAISNVAQAEASNQLRSKAIDDPHLSEVIASALHSWYHRRIYLSAQGKPRALSLRNGNRSLASLIRGEDDKIEASKVLMAMKRLQLLRKTKAGLYLPTRRFATIARLDPVLAEHVCNSLGRLLSTVNFNIRESKSDARFIERSAQVQDLPRHRLDEFRDFANAQGEVFVSTINDWLESRRASSTRGVRVGKARAGVHVFAFSERVPSQRA
ncbi:MAG: DUF6502 family protein [Steroidobacteraceae bacterium]